ncbi:MAG: Hpt domain-containing protein [Bdellovibrionales bacterium]|nr:Hpt domain-containing protein [Bdellovibrionales bacterium]
MASEADSHRPMNDAAALDVPTALIRLNGNLTLYRKLLGVFRDRYRTNLPTPETLSSTTGREQARIFIHSMKGAAGNIAASRVHAEAEALEEHLAEFEAPDSEFVRDRMTRLEQELERAIAEADRFLSPKA